MHSEVVSTARVAD